MKTSSQKLIDDLKELTYKNIAFAQSLQSLADETVNKRPSPDAWSILECLEHLNIYGNYYLPEMEQAIAKSSTAPAETFKSGWLGNYFAESMLPKEKMTKMNALKSMNPIYSKLNKSTIAVFIQQQYILLKLLELSQNKNLSSIKIKISIARFIKIGIGDTFRFLINHNIRHIKQAKNILKS